MNQLNIHQTKNETDVILRQNSIPLTKIIIKLFVEIQIADVFFLVFFFIYLLFYNRIYLIDILT